tara:strand:- start:125 stop:709 length:585 start_codon:yes stop_codon:yes gene_type:complete
MSEIAGHEQFEQVAERVNNEFLEGEYHGETPENHGQAFLEYILKRERIRRDATDAGKRQDAVDYQTLQSLKNAQLDDSAHMLCQVVLQRFGRDPTDAIEYINRVIDEKAAELSKAQQKRAKKPRRGSISPMSNFIDEIVLGNPKITVNKLRHELKSHDGIIEIDGYLRDTVNNDTIKVKSLKDRLYRAKKRKSR